MECIKSWRHFLFGDCWHSCNNFLGRNYHISVRLFIRNLHLGFAYWHYHWLLDLLWTRIFQTSSDICKQLIIKVIWVLLIHFKIGILVELFLLWGLRHLAATSAGKTTTDDIVILFPLSFPAVATDWNSLRLKLSLMFLSHYLSKSESTA